MMAPLLLTRHEFEISLSLLGVKKNRVTDYGGATDTYSYCRLSTRDAGDHDVYRMAS